MKKELEKQMHRNPKEEDELEELFKNFDKKV